MRVAVVQNQDRSGVINVFGQTCPEKYGATAIRNTVESLEQAGHDVLLCDGNKGLLMTLERFMPPTVGGQPSGMVFNMAYGIQGECRYTHVPAMLEMAGVPYTGSSPLGHGLALDKVITKQLIRDVGVPTPNFRVMRRGTEEADDLRFPVVVKPRHESTSFGLKLVHEPRDLPDAVDAIVESYRQDALVEEYIDGREICVGLLGNAEAEILPFVEHQFGDRTTRIVTWEDKVHRSAAEPDKVCPTVVDGRLDTKLRQVALATFRACCCKDFARVDIRVRDGTPYVLEINSMAALGANTSYVLAARTAGYSFSALVNRILDVAHQRYFGIPAPRSAARCLAGGPA